MSRFQHNRIKPAQVVILGFLIQILVGACLLTLPVSTQSGGRGPLSWTPCLPPPRPPVSLA